MPSCFPLTRTSCFVILDARQGADVPRTCVKMGCVVVVLVVVGLCVAVVVVVVVIVACEDFPVNKAEECFAFCC